MAYNTLNTKSTSELVPICAREIYGTPSNTLASV